MKHFAILIIIGLFANIIAAQDIDVYKKKTDDNLRTPNIPTGMSHKEFSLLSTNLRMKDMMYAMIVPGYVHFKAKEKGMGYAILGVRTIGYFGLASVYYSSRIDGSWYEFGKDDNSNKTVKIGKMEVQKSDLIFASSVTLIISTYFFDWIRGEAILKEKQNRIRYKYGLKQEIKQSYSSTYQANILPIASISINI